MAYTVHIYPAHDRARWDTRYGTVSERYPVVMTEWGFMDEHPSPTQSYLNGSAGSYGQPLMEYVMDHGMGWIACWYDDEWEPPMFQPGMKSFTRYGNFVMEQLRRNTGQE